MCKRAGGVRVLSLKARKMSCGSPLNRLPAVRDGRPIYGWSSPNIRGPFDALLPPGENSKSRHKARHKGSGISASTHHACDRGKGAGGTTTCIAFARPSVSNEVLGDALAMASTVPWLHPDLQFANTRRARLISSPPPHTALGLFPTPRLSRLSSTAPPFPRSPPLLLHSEVGHSIRTVSSHQCPLLHKPPNTAALRCTSPSCRPRGAPHFPPP